MIELLLAGVGLLVCAALLVHMVLPQRHRRAVDERARQTWHGLRRAALRLWHWPGLRRRAARQAEAAIRRARGQATRDGNVIRPHSFRRPRKPH
jgi:hypothetical protein